MFCHPIWCHVEPKRFYPTRSRSKQTRCWYSLISVLADCCCCSFQDSIPCKFKTFQNFFQFFLLLHQVCSRVRCFWSISSFLLEHALEHPLTYNCGNYTIGYYMSYFSFPFSILEFYKINFSILLVSYLILVSEFVSVEQLSCLYNIDLQVNCQLLQSHPYSDLESLMIPFTSIVPNGSLVVSLASFSMLSIFDIICLSSTPTTWVSFMVNLVAPNLLFHCLF